MADELNKDDFYESFLLSFSAAEPNGCRLLNVGSNLKIKRIGGDENDGRDLEIFCLIV
ncbi:MAG: hypothetical protein PHT44_01985 [Candidatus Portnoybacteria bacterium]|nr:hypothetical protein [Candidatus Portnoybacteria bacterium]MDD4982636.1 hypothetical protein [Candidatus Portnoybacteria bacterium]